MDEQAHIKAALGSLGELVIMLTEAVARTGAIDQAGNQDRVVGALNLATEHLMALGYGGMHAYTRGAIERVKNSPVHIRRLGSK